MFSFVQVVILDFRCVGEGMVLLDGIQTAGGKTFGLDGGLDDFVLPMC